MDYIHEHTYTYIHIHTYMYTGSIHDIGVSRRHWPTHQSRIITGWIPLRITKISNSINSMAAPNSEAMLDINVEFSKLIRLRDKNPGLGEPKIIHTWGYCTIISALVVC